MNHTETKAVHPSYKGIIFDLDGTLMDTSEGVMSSVRHTTGYLKREPLSEAVLRTFIGPPVKVSLMRVFGLNEDEAEDATQVFRARYKDFDLLKAVPYDGITDLLKSLREHGFKIGVATLKREDYALTLLNHYHISDWCDCICGSDAASKMRKPDVLRNCLAGLGLTNREAVLIGDTDSDGLGAQAVGTDFIGVTFGFGPATKEEWQEFHPVHVAGSPEEIGAFLGL